MEVLTKPQKTSTDNEVIVELQTDAPLKGAIMPNGGRRMVLSFLKTYAMTRPVGSGPFKKYRTYSTDTPILHGQLVCSLMLASRGPSFTKTIL